MSSLHLSHVVCVGLIVYLFIQEFCDICFGYFSFGKNDIFGNILENTLLSEILSEFRLHSI